MCKLIILRVLFPITKRDFSIHPSCQSSYAITKIQWERMSFFQGNAQKPQMKKINNFMLDLFLSCPNIMMPRSFQQCSGPKWPLWKASWATVVWKKVSNALVFQCRNRWLTQKIVLRIQLRITSKTKILEASQGRLLIVFLLRNYRWPF